MSACLVPVLLIRLTKQAQIQTEVVEVIVVKVHVLQEVNLLQRFCHGEVSGASVEFPDDI